MEAGFSAESAGIGALAGIVLREVMRPLLDFFGVARQSRQARDEQAFGHLNALFEQQHAELSKARERIDALTAELQAAKVHAVRLQAALHVLVEMVRARWGDSPELAMAMKLVDSEAQG